LTQRGEQYAKSERVPHRRLLGAFASRNTRLAIDN